MTLFSLATGLFLGLLLGMRHAFEPDHLAAVSVLVTQRRSPRGGMIDHHAAGEADRWTILRQPLLVGVVHGLAGSGALAALAIASLPTLATRLLYMGLFGMGSVAGMASLTGLAGWRLARFGWNKKFPRRLAGATGILSIALGTLWGWAALRGVIRG